MNKKYLDIFELANDNFDFSRLGITDVKELKKISINPDKIAANEHYVLYDYDDNGKFEKLLISTHGIVGEGIIIAELDPNKNSYGFFPSVKIDSSSSCNEKTKNIMKH